MIKSIKLKDKVFELSIPESTIMEAVNHVAKQLHDDYTDKNPLFIIVLSGAFAFASDIIRAVDIPCQIAFTKLASYSGTTSTGMIVEQLPVTEDVNGRHVVIIEDIVETGYSMQYLMKRIAESHPASVEICAFSTKPEQCKVEDLNVKYVGMALPEAFIVGYGLDYDGLGRELRDIYSLKEMEFPRES